MIKFFKQAITILLYLLIAVLILDPADKIFRLKIPLFVITFCLWFVEKLLFNKIRTKKDSIIYIAVYFLVPVIGIFVALVQNQMDNQTFAIGFLKSVLMLTLLFIVDDHGIRMDRMLIRVSIVLPVLTILIFYVFITNTAYFNDVIYPIFSEESGAAAFSIRRYYGFDVFMFFFRTSPLLVFPLGYYTYKMMERGNVLKYLPLVLIFFFTMLLSGTRANILAGVLIVVFTIFSNLMRRTNKLPFLVAFSSFLCLVIVFISNASFSEKDSSQEAKGDHVTAYGKLFDDNPQYFIWGQGLGSEFYTKGFQGFVPQTELTYFDIIRFFGLPFGIIFILITFYPIIKLASIYKRNKEAIYSIILYTAYLFIAGTNPLLISSTGMLAILCIFSTINYLNLKRQVEVVRV